MPFLPNLIYRKTRGIIRRGSRANQPAANTVLEGTLYYITDESRTERSNGSAWESMSDKGSQPVVTGVEIKDDSDGYGPAFNGNPFGVSSGFTQGSVVFVGPSGIVAQDNATFSYDTVSKTLTITHLSGMTYHNDGIHHSTVETYVSGTGTAGVDNTAQTVVSISIPANSLMHLGDRLRVRSYWRGDTGSPITGTVKLGPSGSEVSIADTTDGGAASLQLNEAWLHYVDNTHANLIEDENGALGALSAPNLAGFTWNADQVCIITQNAIANNHIVVFALIVDIMPKGIFA